MSHEKPEIDSSRRNFIKTLFILAGALILGKISGLFSLLSRGTSTPASSAPESTSMVSFPARQLPSGAKEYQDARYGFSLLYPSDLAVSTFDEGGGASTITFQNVERAEGFQIFIVPYNESQVSEQRFKQDVPSGVRESLSNITVDGATAAAFYSTNTALGATREVWVVHGGFLYEVTTLKPLDTWLTAIIQTWKFL